MFKNTHIIKLFIEKYMQDTLRIISGNGCDSSFLMHLEECLKMHVRKMLKWVTQNINIDRLKVKWSKISCKRYSKKSDRVILISK